MSVATDLQSRVGVQRRLFVRIDGLNYDFWEPHEHAAPVAGGDWRTPLECLDVGEETSFSLSIREMAVQPSGLSLQLANIYDSSGAKVHSVNDANTTYLFAQWFAPGSASIEANNANWTYISGSGQIDADATTINVISTANFASSGTAYIGRETFTYSGKTGTSFTGVSKGVYPCVGSSAFGWTYQYPTDTISGGIGNDGQMRVADVPYSLTGRRVALYVTTYDNADQDWQTFADAELLWCGVIAGGIHYLAAEGKWQLDCDSILKECARPVLRNAPRPSWGMEGKTGGFNVRGPDGLRHIVSIRQDNGSSWVQVGAAAMNLTSAHYADAALFWTAMRNSFLAATTSAGLACNIGIYGTAGDATLFCACHTATAPVAVTIECVDGPSLLLMAIGHPTPRQLTIEMGNNVFGSYWVGLVGDVKRFVAFHPIDNSQNGGRFYFDPDTTADIWQKEHARETVYLRVNGLYGKAGQEEPDSTIIAVDQASGGSFPTGTSPSTYCTTKTHQPFLPRGSSSYLAATEGQELEYVYGLESMPTGDEDGSSRGPFELLLYSLLSTGTEDYNGSTYDKMPQWISVGMQEDLVDTASFVNADRAISGLPLTARERYAITAATPWQELLQRECKLFGYALVWRNGKLTLRSILERDPDAYTETLSESNNAQLVEWPDSQSTTDSVINVLEVKHLYDYVEEKYGPPTTLADVDSIEGLGYEGKTSIEHPGLAPVEIRTRNSKSQVDEHLPAIFARLKDLARHPWHRVSVSIAPTYANRIFVGDTVRLQSNTVPDPFGSGSMTSDSWGLVVDLSWDWSSWTGRASLLLYGRYVATAQPWAPAAMVDVSQANGGWDAASYYFTLLPSEFAGLGSGEDGERFEEDDVIAVFDAAQSDPTASSYGWTGLVVDNYNPANNRLTLKNTPTLTGWDATIEHIIVPADWGSVTTSQKGRGTWLASASTGKLSTDAPYRYW